MPPLPKRPRTESFNNKNEDNVQWKKPLTMMDNLRQSTTKLTSLTHTLGHSVSKLHTSAASMEQFSHLAQMDKNSIYVRNQVVDYARSMVYKEAMVEIELYLNEAQRLNDQLGVLANDKKHKDKALEQSIISKDTLSPIQNEDYTSVLAQVEEQLEACQARDQALTTEMNSIDLTLADLELKLEALEQTLASQTARAQAKAQAKAEAEAEAAAMEQKAKEEEEHARVMEWRNEEYQLLQELEALQLQHQQKQQEQQQQQQQQQQEPEQEQQQQQMKTMDDQASIPPTKESAEEQLAILQACADHLRSSPDDAHLIDIHYLKSLLTTLEEDSKMLPSTLETKVTNNRTLLKTYSRTLLSNKSMGYVVRQMIDHLFMDQGYQALTPQELGKKFNSPRQKELVQQFLDRYPILCTD